MGQYRDQPGVNWVKAEPVIAQWSVGSTRISKNRRLYSRQGWGQYCKSEGEFYLVWTLQETWEERVYCNASSADKEQEISKVSPILLQKNTLKIIDTNTQFPIFRWSIRIYIYIYSSMSQQKTKSSIIKSMWWPSLKHKKKNTQHIQNVSILLSVV